ncbi:hypothetical protein LINGRAHAP2_LOCUS4802 [Linum grandiflorum]
MPSRGTERRRSVHDDAARDQEDVRRLQRGEVHRRFIPRPRHRAGRVHGFRIQGRAEEFDGYKPSEGSSGFREREADRWSCNCDEA